MESLSETTWDVLLSGTGLSQSLLALALSRSGKKVLHIDRNDYYGGPEAALSLQEAETWAEKASKGAEPSPFSNVAIKNVEHERSRYSDDKAPSKLGFSRAYSLSLSPQLVYTRSNLLPALVSSKVYRQLEFLAMGSWWIYSDKEQEVAGKDDTHEAGTSLSHGSLRKIPGGREDVFRDTSVDRKSAMSLMKFLKLAADSEAHASILEEWGDKPFPDFLQSRFNISPRLQRPLLSLTLSSDIPAKTSTSYSFPRIHRHLTSIGMFGPGFGSVIPKWGGLAEIAQVACRAGAVGGGVYVLKKGLETIRDTNQHSSREEGNMEDGSMQPSTVCLEGGEEVKTRWIICSQWDLPSQTQERLSPGKPSACAARSITIVFGMLSELFPPPAEGAPPSAGAVVVFPSDPSTLESKDQISPPPVYLMIHSSDTGECPTGQCLIYAYTSHPESSKAHALLQTAVERLLARVHEDPTPSILWYMHYDQQYTLPPTANDWETNVECDRFSNPHILQLPDMMPGLVLEDDVLKHVRAAYDRIVGDENAGFMSFEDREGVGDLAEGEGGEEL